MRHLNNVAISELAKNQISPIWLQAMFQNPFLIHARLGIEAREHMAACNLCADKFDKEYLEIKQDLDVLVVEVPEGCFNKFELRDYITLTDSNFAYLKEVLRDEMDDAWELEVSLESVDIREHLPKCRECRSRFQTAMEEVIEEQEYLNNPRPSPEEIRAQIDDISSAYSATRLLLYETGIADFMYDD